MSALAHLFPEREPEYEPAASYLPIAEHGVIGDLRTVALVGTDGTIDWYCAPHFDSPSVFGSILDAEHGGYYKISPVCGCSTKQLYFPDTNVLITRFLSERGVAEVQDFMPVGRRQQLIRRVVCIRGEIRFRVECEPRFNYGRDDHEVVVEAGGALFVSPSLSLTLSASAPLLGTENGVVGEFTLAAGETETFVLQEAEDGRVALPMPEDEADAWLDVTIRYWLDWISKSTYTGRWRETVTRSALALKLLTFEPTGAIVAAATTSLPEQIGGERNWDYRYTWIRDAAFSLYALVRLGFTEEFEAFGDFLKKCFHATAGNGSHPLQIMYGIDGRLELPEEILDHFEGYARTSPVRIGNGAADQLQLDIYGELLDAGYLLELYGRKKMPYDAWVALRQIIDWVCENWQQPDEGIWETRGGRQHFTHSRLMCWVALDRAIRIAQRRSFPADLIRWMQTRDEIHHWLMEQGWNEDKQAFVQHDETDVLDAAVLLMPLVHFITPTDPRWLSTLDAIGNELVSDSLVYRYDPAASPDGLAGDEGTFSICSFWYVQALALAGRVDEARIAFEKMLTYGNHLGLFSEEIGPSGELLGNFPQAFTHLALITAAITLDEALG
jgi:GH15 family glucan-1,4-alpha-glucosidase